MKPRWVTSVSFAGRLKPREPHRPGMHVSSASDNLAKQPPRKVIVNQRRKGHFFRDE
jgi:hypothetical protein